MKALILTLISLPGLLIAQPTITNCENFPIGTILQFQTCDTTGVTPGSSGANQTWNFASLSALPTISTQWIISPSSTTQGSLFPNANLVEKYSDGSFVFLRKTVDSTYLVGYTDTVNSYVYSYPNSCLLLLRPMTYNLTASDSFAITFTGPGVNFTGNGQSTINADGYGTLILPNGTFNNVLRVKVVQTQLDTFTLPINSSGTTVTTTYIWFDSSHASALLKMDQTQSAGYNSRTVQYLLKDSVSAVQTLNHNSNVKLYPNPAADQFHVTNTGSGLLTIRDQLGRTVETIETKGDDTPISTSNLISGIYFLTLETGEYRQTLKLVVQH